MRRRKFRFIVILSALCIAGYAIHLKNKPVTYTGEREPVDLERMLPESFKGWEGVWMDTTDCRDRRKTLDSRLARLYTNKEKKVSVRLVVEYSSDLRNNFSFNFPEQCARKEGNAVQVLKPLNVIMPDNRFLRGRCLFIHGDESGLLEHDRLVYYWVVMGQKQFYDRRQITIDRIRSWFRKEVKHGFLVRVDHQGDLLSGPGFLKDGRAVIEEFLKDLYVSMPRRKSLVLIFGAE